MENNQNVPLPFSAIGLIHTKGRACEHCGGYIANRNRKAKYCTDSCKEMAYLKRKNESPPEESSDEVSMIDNNSSMQSTPAETKVQSNETKESQTLLVHEEVKSWESATDEQKRELELFQNIARQIEDCVKAYTKKELYEIPKNKIHALLPVSMKINNVDNITLPKFALRISSDKSTYLICKNK